MLPSLLLLLSEGLPFLNPALMMLVSIKRLDFSSVPLINFLPNHIIIVSSKQTSSVRHYFSSRKKIKRVKKWILEKTKPIHMHACCSLRLIVPWVWWLLACLPDNCHSCSPMKDFYFFNQSFYFKDVGCQKQDLLFFFFFFPGDRIYDPQSLQFCPIV